MPELSEYLQRFGTGEVLIAILTLAVILIAREEKRIFRRKR